MALTKQQEDAVFQRKVSVVLSSGAGCGKTHVLTNRYLSHLTEDGADVNQIVAITFTDRAARQMRWRIRQAVLDQLNKAQADHQVDLWESHLRGLETAHICTIHSFCAYLLRQNAVAAGLDPRFEVLQDNLALNLANEALSEGLQELLTADSLTGSELRELVYLYGWKSVLFAVQRLLRQGDAAAQVRWSNRATAEIAAEWLAHARENVFPRFLEYLTRANPKIARCLWLLKNRTCTGPKMAFNTASVFAGFSELRNADASQFESTIQRILAVARVANTERVKAWPSEDDYQQIKSALRHLRAELPERMELFRCQNDDLKLAIEAGRCFVHVAQQAREYYEQLKRRHGVVDFQDLLVKTRDLLRDDRKVRDQLQGRFRYLLIDELQDTDPVQMELIELLSGSGLTDGRLFAVGDHAQSIYRFRGADVQLFQKLRSRMSPAGQLELTRNFRSQPAILDFVNALFMNRSHGAGDVGVFESFEPLAPHVAQVSPGPCLEFLWSQRQGKQVFEAREMEAEWIATRIAEMVRGKERLVSDRADEHGNLRAVRPGDVVLLFRTMTNVEIYETALRRFDLDYYLVGGRAFFAQQETHDVLNLLRALENPWDGVSMAGVLRSPFCCLSDEALYVLSQNGRGLWSGIHDRSCLVKLPPGQRERTELAQRHLERWHKLKNRVSIARLLGTVVADSGYDAALQFEALGDRKLANLWKLIDMARDVDRSGLFRLSDFIKRLSDLVAGAPREEQAATQPENADVVRLMTIHQAKGLEFPVVFLPDVAAAVGGLRYSNVEWDDRLGCVARPPNEDPPPFSKFGWELWTAKEAIADWRESLRTLYVACTRAEDYLVLSAALNSDFSPETPWMLALAERFDLQTGECLIAGLPADQTPRIQVVTDIPIPPQQIQSESAPSGSNVSDDFIECIWDSPVDMISAADEAARHAAQWDAEGGADIGDWADSL